MVKILPNLGRELIHKLSNRWILIYLTISTSSFTSKMAGTSLMTITIKQANFLFMLPLSFYTLLINGDISQRDGQIGRIRLKQPKRRYLTFGRSHTNIV